MDISGLVRTSGRMARRFSATGVCSQDTRDSSPAVATGGPQRWRPCCRLNLACGRWLVRSSLGSRGIGAEEEQGKPGWLGWRALLFSRPQSGMQFTWCPTSAIRATIPPSSSRFGAFQPVSTPPCPDPPILSVPRISRIRTREPKGLGAMLPALCIRYATVKTSHTDGKF